MAEQEVTAEKKLQKLLLLCAVCFGIFIGWVTREAICYISNRKPLPDITPVVVPVTPEPQPKPRPRPRI